MQLVNVASPTNTSSLRPRVCERSISGQTVVCSSGESRITRLLTGSQKYAAFARAVPNNHVKASTPSATTTRAARRSSRPSGGASRRERPRATTLLFGTLRGRQVGGGVAAERHWGMGESGSPCGPTPTPPHWRRSEHVRRRDDAAPNGAHGSGTREHARIFTADNGSDAAGEATKRPLTLAPVIGANAKIRED
eukprot:scaffold17331_cov125-Isochrysis_galbana.AAC.1